MRSSRPFSKARRVNSPASAGRQPSILAERLEHSGNDRMAAVKLQLGRVLAGLAARRRKPEHQRFVDRLAGRRIAQARQRRLPRRRHAADQLSKRGAARAAPTRAPPQSPPAAGRKRGRRWWGEHRSYQRCANQFGARQRFAPRGLLATVRPCQRQPRRFSARRSPKPPRARDQPLSAAAPAQPGRLVGLGAGGAGGSQAHQQADPALGRLCGLSLVPRDGARKFRGRRHRAGDERAVRQHQGRPRGAARHRSDLHGGAASSRRAGRLAADHVSHARRRADLGRHLFSQFVALRQTGFRRRAARGRAAVPRGAAEDRA